MTTIKTNKEIFSDDITKKFTEILDEQEVVDLKGDKIKYLGGEAELTVKKFAEINQIVSEFMEEASKEEKIKFKVKDTKENLLNFFKIFVGRYVEGKKSAITKSNNSSKSKTEILSEERALVFLTSEIIVDMMAKVHKYVLVTEDSTVIVPPDKEWESIADMRQLTAKELWTVATHAKILYHPYMEIRGDMYDPELGVKTNFVNVYTPPPWKKIINDVSANIHPTLLKFFQHLFCVEGDEDSEKNIQYVFFWMKNFMTRRNGTMLALTGFKGIGKGLFATKVCRALVGGKNFELFSDHVLESQFNSGLENRTLCFFDEVNIDNSVKKDNLKLYCNDEIPLEKKGKDKVDVENFSSFILATNTLTGLGIDPSDRRFSVPELTSIPLKEGMPELEIAEFITLCERSIRGEVVQEIAELAKYILEFEPNPEFKFTFDSPYKSKTFYMSCEASLTGVKKVVRDMITSKALPYYTIEHIRDTLREIEGNDKLRANAQTIGNFLFEYKLEGKYVLGGLGTIKVTNPITGADDLEITVVKPAPRFCPIHYIEGETISDYEERMKLLEISEENKALEKPKAKNWDNHKTIQEKAREKARKSNEKNKKIENEDEDLI
jgi:hypothetical protein